MAIKKKDKDYRNTDGLVKKGDVSPSRGKKLKTKATEVERRKSEVLKGNANDESGNITTGKGRGTKTPKHAPKGAKQADGAMKTDKSEKDLEQEPIPIEVKTKALQPLNAAEEIFINEILRGKTQVEAYLVAYPSKKNLKQSTLSASASKLYRSERIQYRHGNLMEAITRKERVVTEWTRDESRRTLMGIIKRNVADADRIEMAYEKEAELNHAVLSTISADMQKHKVGTEPWVKLAAQADLISRTIIDNEKQRRMSMVTNDGILKPTIELNNMMGFNRDENQASEVAVTFTGWDDIKD